MDLETRTIDGIMNLLRIIFDGSSPNLSTCQNMTRLKKC